LDTKFIWKCCVNDLKFNLFCGRLIFWSHRPTFEHSQLIIICDSFSICCRFIHNLISSSKEQHFCYVCVLHNENSYDSRSIDIFGSCDIMIDNESRSISDKAYYWLSRIIFVLVSFSLHKIFLLKETVIQTTNLPFQLNHKIELWFI
jgi:hypothetical protein